MSHPERHSTRIGRNFVYLVVARVAVMAMTLIQLGIVFRALGVEGTGQFGFALSYTMLFSVLATFGIQRLLVRDITRDSTHAWTCVWTASTVVLVLALTVCALVCGAIYLLRDDPIVRRAVVYASLSTILIGSVQAPFEALLTARERMGHVAVVYVVSGVLRVASVYWVMTWQATSAGVHAALAVANGIGLALCVALAVRVAGWERPRVRLSLAFQQIRQSFPFFAAVVFSQIYFRSDVSILEWLAGSGAVGLYTPAQRVMEPLLMLATIWGTAIFPALCRFSRCSTDKYGRLQASSIRMGLLMAFPMGVGLACVAGPVIHLLAGAEFAGSVALLKALCLIMPFFYLSAIAQEGLYAAGRDWFVVSVYAIASVVNVGLNLLLVPRLGVNVLPWTAVVANLFVSLAVLPTQYASVNLGSLIAKTAAACAVMAAGVVLVNEISWIAAVPVGAAIYGLAQWGLRTLNPDERRLLTGLARSMFGHRAMKAAVDS